MRALPISVIIDEHHAREASRLWQGVSSVICYEHTDVASLLKDVLDGEPYGVVIHGDDRLIGRVVNAYHGVVRHHDVPLRILPVMTGTLRTISQSLGVDRTPRQLAKHLRHSVLAEDSFDHVTMPSLKVSSSMEDRAHYGFSFGAGWFYTAFEHYQRRNALSTLSAAVQWGREAIEEKELSATLTPVNLSIDYHPVIDSVGYLLASTLDKSWFGVSMARKGSIAMQYGVRTKELFRDVTSSRRLASLFHKGVEPHKFERFHLSWSSGYVLDGELFAPSRPYALQVTSGPQVHFLKCRRSRLDRLVKRVSG